MKIITARGIFENFSVFATITDEQLAKIETQPDIVHNIDFVKDLMAAHGDNAHMIQLTLEEPRNIVGYMDLLLKRYKSVSWVRDNKFFIRRSNV